MPAFLAGVVLLFQENITRRPTVIFYFKFDNKVLELRHIVLLAMNGHNLASVYVDT